MFYDFFGLFGDTENTELPEQKVHRRYMCLLSYGTCAALPLVWCVVEIIMKRDPVIDGKAGMLVKLSLCAPLRRMF